MLILEAKSGCGSGDSRPTVKPDGQERDPGPLYPGPVPTEEYSRECCVLFNNGGLAIGRGRPSGRNTGSGRGSRADRLRPNQPCPDRILARTELRGRMRLQCRLWL
jgi:hypothetical protein